MGEKLTKQDGAVFNEGGQLVGTFVTGNGGNSLSLECDPPLDTSTWNFGPGLILGQKYWPGNMPVGSSIEVECIQHDANGAHCLRWMWTLYDANGQFVARGSFV